MFLIILQLLIPRIRTHRFLAEPQIINLLPELLILLLQEHPIHLLPIPEHTHQLPILLLQLVLLTPQPFGIPLALRIARLQKVYLFGDSLV